MKFCIVRFFQMPKLSKRHSQLKRLREAKVRNTNQPTLDLVDVNVLSVTSTPMVLETFPATSSPASKKFFRETSRQLENQGCVNMVDEAGGANEDQVDEAVSLSQNLAALSIDQVGTDQYVKPGGFNNDIGITGNRIVSVTSFIAMIDKISTPAKTCSSFNIKWRGGSQMCRD